MQASSNPLDPRAVLGAVKTRPGNAGASRKPSATAGLDRPCARRDRRSAGRDEGTALGSNKGTAAISGASDDVTTLSTVSSRGLREDETRWRFGLPGACEHW
jgi:hypothetical protein